MNIIKYKKKHKENLKKKNINCELNDNLALGNYGIKCLNYGFLQYKHIEKVRRRIAKQFKRIEKKRFCIYIRIFTWHFYTKKPLLSRMGKGVGSIFCWLTFLKKGKIFLELSSYKPISIVKSIIIKSVLLFPLKTICVQK